VPIKDRLRAWVILVQRLWPMMIVVAILLV
jgi:hypothetical protein